mgnify:FL=1
MMHQIQFGIPQLSALFVLGRYIGLSLVMSFADVGSPCPLSNAESKKITIISYSFKNYMHTLEAKMS